MNRPQKMITIVALVVLAVSAFNAPWTCIHPGHTDPIWNDPRTETTVYAPLWNPPETSGGDTCHLNPLPVVGTWFVVGAGYAGLFFLLKTKPTKAKLADSKRFFEKN